VSAYDVDASPIGATALDAFGVFALNDGSPQATFTRRILAGLTLVAKGTPHRGKAGKLTFSVLDAGDPVKGAKVKAGGASGKTGANGKVTLSVRPTGRSLTAHATRSGYTAAARRLKVKR
jgi:hypothetical protein